jgi:hypothetical protein
MVEGFVLEAIRHSLARNYAKPRIHIVLTVCVKFRILTSELKRRNPKSER